MMPHLVLAGDSVFDNASYVPGGPAVPEQVQHALGPDWQVTLRAVDGAVVAQVPAQLAQLPANATHLAISAGGNNALQSAWVLMLPTARVDQAMQKLAEVQTRFRQQYAAMMRAAAASGLPRIVCTIYDAIPAPELPEGARAALSLFNDVIVQEALRWRAAVLDLRAVCCRPEHFSELSPIEPSVAGGLRIAAALASFLKRHIAGWDECILFGDPLADRAAAAGRSVGPG